MLTTGPILELAFLDDIAPSLLHEGQSLDARYGAGSFLAYEKWCEEQVRDMQDTEPDFPRNY